MTRSRTLPPTADVLGYAVLPTTLAGATDRVLDLGRAERVSTALVVTLNPELIVRAESDAALRRALTDASLTVADGVGVVWAARRRGVQLPMRVAGIDLAESVLRAGGAGLRTYLYGGRPGVAAAAAAAATARFGASIVGTHHGYVEPRAERDVVAAIRASGAELLLCALGERQELFIHRNAEALGAAVAIGVGGTLDVWAGTAKRTPGWTRRLRIEWLWRVVGDPARWHRIPRLLRFVQLALRS
jgi:N-acetylglucosaminyldiphosphoundecaprenol N-acetyl-beta-D-mannosaminyltransferase